jgi:intracellular septation protein
MALITFVLVAVFGGLTLFFHNDEFIKWKVTVMRCLRRAAVQPVGHEKAAYPAHAG